MGKHVPSTGVITRIPERSHTISAPERIDAADTAVSLPYNRRLLGGDVCSVPVEESAAARALWLAQLEEALKDAQRVLEEMPLPTHEHSPAQDLHMRIQTARLEVQTLRLSRSLNPPGKVRPEWTETSPWSRL
jgi:hypothetical protein